MNELPCEETRVHSRLLKLTGAVEESRDYWTNVGPSLRAPGVVHAFENHWFGGKSQARVEALLSNMKARYDAFPDALEVLRHWRPMEPDTRRIVCHWHLQLSDPMVRRFGGHFLIRRRGRLSRSVTRAQVIQWVEEQQPGRWAASTRIQWASKLLTAAYESGLVTTNRDPRPLAFPKVPPVALEYGLYLLRGVRFDGTLLQNPYFASVGLSGRLLEDRLRALPSVDFLRMGDLVDFQWRHKDLLSWAEASL